MLFAAVVAGVAVAPVGITAAVKAAMSRRGTLGSCFGYAAATESAESAAAAG